MIPRPQIWGRALLGCVCLMPLLMSPIITGILVDFGGMTDSQAGMTSAYSGVGAVSMALICALSMHHLPLRRLALAGLGLAMLTNLASAYLYEQHTVFYLLRALNSFGDGACYAAVMSSYARERSSERCYGLFMTLQFLLSGIAIYALPTFFPDMDVRQLYLMFCVFNILALPLTALLPERAALAEGISIRASEWRLLLTVPALAGLGALCFFETSNTANFAYVERIAVAAGLSDDEIGLALGVSSVAGVPGAFAIVFLGARFGHAKPALVGIGLGALALVWLMQSSGFVSYLLSTSAISLTWAFALPYLQSVLADQDAGGAVVTAGGIATGAGGGLGPAFAASMVTATDYSGVLWVGTTAYALSASCILLALLASQVRGGGRRAAMDV